MKKLGKTIGCLTIPASILSLSQVLWEDMEQFYGDNLKTKEHFEGTFAAVGQGVESTDKKLAGPCQISW